MSRSSLSPFGLSYFSYPHLPALIKTVLIDLDETLWATRINNRDALEEVYHAHGWGEHFDSFETFFRKYEPHNDHVWDLYRIGTITKAELTLDRFRTPLLPEISLTDEEILEINADFLSRAATKEKVIPGAIELLRELKSLYTIVILSNGFEEVQAQKMASSGLLPYIDHIVLSETAGANKPSRRIYDYAFSISRSRPSESIMIGDSWEADIIGAETAGIPAIWYNPMKLPTPRPLRVPLHIITSLSEVIPILRQYLLPRD